MSVNAAGTPAGTITLRLLNLAADGLVESRERPIDSGLEQLRKHAASLAHRPLAAFTNLLLERVRPATGSNEDDIAVLAVRTPEIKSAAGEDF